jgi:YHS domain-containing protein
MTVTAIVAGFTAAVVHAQQAPQEALDGLDPVLLIQGKEVAGKPGLTVVRGRFEYAFSSAETRATFESAPDRFEIQMNGVCARMGPSAGGNPSDFFVYDGRIYIFGSDECHKRFVATPTRSCRRSRP